MPFPNDPALVAKALAKAQASEQRLNALIASQGAPLISYAPLAASVTTQSTAGVYSWTCPAGVTQVLVECWGGGGGGCAGSATVGGAGGGGGEYSSEPAYPVTPGQVYSYVVGKGGSGMINVGARLGLDGGDSYFDINGNYGGVIASGGSGSSTLTGGGPGGGPAGGGGGFYGYNSATSPGGSGGGDGYQLTGGCGGGESGSAANVGAAGNDGSDSGGSTGGAGGSGTGGSAGGSGGNAGSTGQQGTGVGAGGGGSGAFTAAGNAIYTYPFTSSASYYGSDAIGGNASKKRTSPPGESDLWQGGQMASGGTYNGTQKSLMILPSSVVTDLAGVAVVAYTLTVTPQFSLTPSLHVHLGYTGQTAAPATWDGATGLTSLSAFPLPFTGAGFNGPNSTSGGFGFAPGAPVTQDLTGIGLSVPLTSGTARALAIGPGTAQDPLAYGELTGAGVTGHPVLTVYGHTGVSWAQGGNGGAGQVKITVLAQGLPTAAMMAQAAVTDEAGNAFGAGFTGNIAAFRPGSSPAVVETWHNVTGGYTGGWTGTVARYKMLAEQNAVWLQMTLTPGTLTDATAINTITSSAYWPATTVNLWAGTRGGTAAVNDAIIQVTAAGVIQCLSMPTGTTSVRVNGIYALD